MISARSVTRCRTIRDREKYSAPSCRSDNSIRAHAAVFIDGSFSYVPGVSVRWSCRLFPLTARTRVISADAELAVGRFSELPRGMHLQRVRITAAAVVD